MAITSLTCADRASKPVQETKPFLMSVKMKNMCVRVSVLDYFRKMQ